jgi:hypothetical protein
MAEEKKTSPSTVTLMVLALIAVVGIIAWEVRALSGGPPKQDAKPDAQAVTTPLQAQQGTAAQTGGTGARRVASAQAGNAVAKVAPPRANPFEPLQGSAKGAAPAPTARPLPPVPTPSTGTVPAPVLIARDRQLRAAALSASLGGGQQSGPAQSTSPAKAGTATSYLPLVGQAMGPVVPPEPVLLGTMLGARPVAVFQAEKSSVIVPQGGVFMGWKVLRVSHGEVTVAVGPTKVQLRVGSTSPSAPGPVGRSTSQIPISVESYAAANCITVHYTGRPALSHTELVYGRRDNPSLDYPIREPVGTGHEVATEPETQPIGQPASPPEVQQTGSS